MNTQKFWKHLHDKVGRCGHCFGSSCPDRRKWSVLPDKLSTALVVEAAKAATEAEAPAADEGTDEGDAAGGQA